VHKHHVAQSTAHAPTRKTVVADIGDSTRIEVFGADAKDGLYETWEDIEKEYMKDEYPVFGGPFNNALKPFEWLKKYYNEPKRK
jgi:hypothetical protein